MLKSENDEEEIIRQDYERFVQFIHNYILPFEPQSHKAHAPIHYKMMWYACLPISATAAPRGSLKSSIMARYRALHRLVNPSPNTNPLGKIEGLTVSETTSLAKDHLHWVKTHILKNKHILRDFGQLANPSTLTWNEDEIELTNGNSWAALGYGSAVRGRHPTDIIVDDLESLQNMGTEESLKKLMDWFLRVLMGAMVPETRLMVIGTIIARKSMLSTILKMEEFRGRVWRALITNGEGDLESVWPYRWPVEYLIKKKKLLGLHAFNAEFQNDPLGLGDPIVMPEWIVRHTWKDLQKNSPVRRYITVDPAFTEERWGDFSAIIMMDEATDGTLMERLAWRKKVALPELTNSIIKIHEQACEGIHEKNVHIGIEEVAAQKAVRQSISEKNQRLGAKIIPIKPDKDKTRRLIDVSRHFENRRVSLMTEQLIEELMQFPNGDKDRVDALVYAIKLYEIHHQPSREGDQCEVDFMGKLGQNELEAVMDSIMNEDFPMVHVKSSRLKSYIEAKRLAEAFEGML